MQKSFSTGSQNLISIDSIIKTAREWEQKKISLNAVIILSIDLLT
jgi:hypothetical protein